MVEGTDHLYKGVHMISHKFANLITETIVNILLFYVLNNIKVTTLHYFQVLIRFLNPKFWSQTFGQLVVSWLLLDCFHMFVKQQTT